MKVFIIEMNAFYTLFDNALFNHYYILLKKTSLNVKY